MPGACGRFCPAARMWISCPSEEARIWCGQSRDVVQSGAEILAAAGDDGTVNGVASAVVNRAAREAY
jgi:hypothetical protein